MKELPKTYDASNVEHKIYERWVKSGYFNPDKLPKNHKDPYCISMPPPNVTGTLHIGHALFVTIQDALIRFARMRGKKALWVPGTDHAAIATQSKVEKEIYKKEKKTRHDYGRVEFLKLVEKFAKNSHDTIITQLKRMGSSCDWSRKAYTLDKDRTLAVRTAFKNMYEDGLIYRGARIVNWDPRLSTTVSDDEVEWEESKTPFYYIKYGPFTIGTARPETKFGDKYVVMHPDDKRYKKYKHGDKLEVDWINGKITATVIKDKAVEQEFGTGVMTITPWHDKADFDIAERHNLDKEQIIDYKGKLLPVARELAGIHIKKARPMIVEKLKKLGLLEKVDENYVNRIAKNSRGGELIEPQIKEQWFVDVNKKFKAKTDKLKGIKKGQEISLKELMRRVVKSGQIKITPTRFEKNYYHWIDNLRDWCVSRQIWYGHQIPVWNKDSETYVGIEAPEGKGWIQDSDTLDTWFSSGLWTFSTLGWPKKTSDLKIYHPTDVMETGYDILFFWIARMILMSGYHLGDIPFKNIYMHGLVRDRDRQKMSKSKGNVIDPLGVIDLYGTDALRMALVFSTAAGNDIPLAEDKIRGMKHFANKLWNISRYIFMNMPTNSELQKTNSKPNPITKADEDILKKLESTVQKITQDLEKFRLHEAAQEIYQFTWHEFADKYIESSKPQLKDEKTKESTLLVLHYTLTTILKLLHPFMPFITEEIWSYLKQKNQLIISNWPSSKK